MGGSIWSNRWRNELSPDQRCWTPNTVQHRRRVSSGRPTRSAPPGLRPVVPCPSLGPRGWESKMALVRKVASLGRTLDDLPMQHTQEEALCLLEKRRAETAAQRRNLTHDGDQIKVVSSFGRRMFDSAVSNRGQDQPPPPSASEAAALFFRASVPPWSALSHPEKGQPSESLRLKPRPHSTISEITPAVPPNSLLCKSRPDSEPPTRWYSGREFNHLRYHRQVYPHINRLVQRYNEDMRVVCTQTPEVCEKRRNSRDFSVASEFYLVPLKQNETPDSVRDEAEAEAGREEDEITLTASIEPDLTLQPEFKIEDQLATHSDKLKTRSLVASSEASDFSKRSTLSKGTDEREEPEPPWRCWVDDATVSTVHSRAASEAALEDGDMVEGPLKRHSSVARKSVAIDKSAMLLTGDAAKFPKPARTSESAEEPSKSLASIRTSTLGKDKKGKKKKGEVSPEPPIPVTVEEPPIVVEEIVEEEEVEPEPEPEPLPPSYICPSSESKSHNVEIRRWLSKSPFRAATRTMPIF